MDDSILLEKLCMFGLTRQEASLYLCLINGGEMSGYEAAKQTGISRSNAYGGLAGLVEEGAAYVIEGDAIKYVAVSLEEFCSNKIRMLEKEKEYLANNLKLNSKQEEGYITITGYKHIINKIYTMLERAEYRIYLAAPTYLIGQLQKELEAVIRRQIKLVLMTDGRVSMKNAIIYQTEKRDQQLRLIIDSEYVLTGEITGSTQDACLYTGQKNFVNVFKDALRNEMKLIELSKGE